MRKYAVVFVHGLAKKPSPEKLEEIWRWGLERADTPAPFDGDNPGIYLDIQRLLAQAKVELGTLEGADQLLDEADQMSSKHPADLEYKAQEKDYNALRGRIRATVRANGQRECARRVNRLLPEKAACGAELLPRCHCACAAGASARPDSATDPSADRTGPRCPQTGNRGDPNMPPCLVQEFLFNSELGQLGNATEAPGKLDVTVCRLSRTQAAPSV